MRPVDFTPEQIIEAGQALQSAGRSITGFALRQKVGGGNANRLKQVWDEHLSSQTIAEAEPMAELPVEVAQELSRVTEALVARLGAMAVDINDRAVKASERRVADVVRAAGEQREQAERELADATETVDDLEQQLDSAQEACDSLKQQLGQIQASKQEQAVELAQLRERLASVEKSAKEAAANAVAQVKLLQGQLEEQRRLEQMAREREAQATGAVAQMERQHLEDAAVCQDLRTELRALSASFSQSEAVSKSRGDELEQIKQELKTVRGELKMANAAEATANGREQAALARIKELEAKAAKPVAEKAPAKTPRAKSGAKEVKP